MSFVDAAPGNVLKFWGLQSLGEKRYLKFLPLYTHVIKIFLNSYIENVKIGMQCL